MKTSIPLSKKQAKQYSARMNTPLLINTLSFKSNHQDQENTSVSVISVVITDTLLKILIEK